MGELNGKKLLLLGGIAHAMEIVKAAQKMGAQVFVTDYFETSPCKQLADKGFTVSTTDVDAVVKLCKEEQVDGVITGFIDSMLPYCEKVCKAMDFPFWGTQEQIDICINKDKFKNCCKKYGVPVTREYDLSCDGNGDLLGDLGEIQYPVIVKPVDNSGSRGIFVCEDLQELRENYKKALGFSKSRTILVEEYVQGQHVNMYYTLCDGEIKLSAMADRYVDYLDHQSAPLPVCLVHPSRYLEEYRRETDVAVRNMFRALGMENGVAFVQGFRANDGSFKIYEMGYRLNGGGTYSLIEACSGYNQLEMLIRYSLTGKMGNEKEFAQADAAFDETAICYVLSVSGGAIGTIRGLDALREFPEVKNVVQVRFDGDSVTGQGGSAQVVAYVLFVTENTATMKDVIERIHATVCVKDQDGNTMQMTRLGSEELPA